MKEELFRFIEEKTPGAKPLLLVIRGSHAYGTNIETSDTDYGIERAQADQVESDILEIDKLFAESSLTDSVDAKFVGELLIKIRKNIYNIL